MRGDTRARDLLHIGSAGIFGSTPGTWTPGLRHGVTEAKRPGSRPGVTETNRPSPGEGNGPSDPARGRTPMTRPDDTGALDGVHASGSEDTRSLARWAAVEFRALMLLPSSSARDFPIAFALGAYIP